MTNLFNELTAAGNLPKHVALLTVHGSRAYGTNTPESDTDVKGVCFAPLSTYLGFRGNFEQKEFKRDDLDCEGVVYEVRKFLKLAADSNPNICEVLWTDPSDHLFVSDLGQELLDRRGDFLSKKARFTFAGYAASQLKRIKSHRNWLLDPPKGRPQREDFGLAGDGAMTPSQLGAFKELENKGHEFSGDVVTVLQKEKAYHNALTHYKQYKNWEKSRNPKRAQQERDFGYDTKHAMHLVRLSRMCVEILEGKGVVVKRPDAEELNEIRNGLWSYERVVEHAENLDAKAGELYKTSSLPDTVDYDSLNEFCVNLVERYWL